MSRYPFDPPADWHTISEYIGFTERRMREIVSEDRKGEKIAVQCWPIFRLHNERTRHIYNLAKSGDISKELYKYCVRSFYCDHILVSYWKRNGYEALCCLRCVQNDSRYGNLCICRVPKRNLGESASIECESCGCTGCSGN